MSTLLKNVQLTIQQKVPSNTGFSKDVDNVLQYGSNTTGLSTNLASFVNAWRTAHEATFLAIHDYSWILYQYVAKELDHPEFADYESVQNTHGSYNATPGAPAPSINAAFFFNKSFNSGRSSHGGIHLGGLPLNGIAGNEFTPAFQVILNAWYAIYLAGFTDSIGITWLPTIMSRKKSSLQMPPPVVDVSSYLVYGNRSFLDKDVGTMRRRKEKTAR